MKLTNEQREQVIELRRRHSLHKVASLAGLSVGTVKAIVSRSGLFSDNPQHRALFTPPANDNGEERDTKAEALCLDALRGLTPVNGEYPPEQVAERFRAIPESMPHTLSDCLHELAYWDEYHQLRRASDLSHDESLMVVNARGLFVFCLLAELRPRTRDEARVTLQYLMSSERRRIETDRILNNLIG